MTTVSSLFEFMPFGKVCFFTLCLGMPMSFVLATYQCRSYKQKLESLCFRPGVSLLLKPCDWVKQTWRVCWLIRGKWPNASVTQDNLLSLRHMRPAWISQHSPDSRKQQWASTAAQKSLLPNTEVHELIVIITSKFWSGLWCSKNWVIQMSFKLWFYFYLIIQYLLLLHWEKSPNSFPCISE